MIPALTTSPLVTLTAPMVIYLWRHGQTDTDANNQFGGWTYEDMNATGLADVEHVAKTVVSQLKFGLVFTDDLTRTNHTAKIALLYSQSAKHIIVSTGFRAWGCGNLSERLKTVENLALKKHYVDHPNEVPPGDSAESIAHSEHRLLSAVAYAISMTPPGEASLIALHSSGIKVVSKTYGTKIKVNPSGLVKMTITGDGQPVKLEILNPGRPEVVAPDDDRTKKLRVLRYMA